VSYNTAIVGSGTIQHFHAEPMVQNAKNTVVLTRLNIIGRWHGVAKQTPKPTCLG